MPKAILSEEHIERVKFLLNRDGAGTNPDVLRTLQEEGA